MKGIWSIRPWHDEQPIAFLHVDAVVEIDEAGQIIDPVPAERLVGAVTFADRLQHGAADPNLPVAVHAGFRGRNAGERGVFHRGMAIAAIDAQNADVVLVAEGDGLHHGSPMPVPYEDRV